jgi:trimeric autotransporter adhesin
MDGFHAISSVEATLGFPAGYVNTLPYPYFPTITLLSNTISGQSPSWTVYWSRNAMASVSKYSGRHSISLGFDYRLIHTDFLSLTNGSANFSFNGVFSRQYPTTTNGTGADFADLLMGYPSSGVVQTAVKLFDFTRYYAGYLQDDIRVNTRLTLNVGLRYEYETGIGENHNNLVVGFNQTANNPLANNVTGITPLGTIQYAGVNGNPTGCCSPSGTKFGPRVGAAYQLNAKTTVRAGWAYSQNTHAARP